MWVNSYKEDLREGWVAAKGAMGPENRDQGPMQQVTCPGVDGGAAVRQECQTRDLPMIAG